MKQEICAMFDTPKIELTEDALSKRDKFKRTQKDIFFIKTNDLNYSTISRSSDMLEDYKENNEVNQIKMKTYNSSIKNTGNFFFIFFIKLKYMNIHSIFKKIERKKKY